MFPSNEIYFIRFSSSQPICLESVGFYGRKLTSNEYIAKHFRDHCNKESEDKDKEIPPTYAMLTLGIAQSRNFYPNLGPSQRLQFMERMSVEVEVSKYTQDDVFFVKLPDSIPIPANIIFDIEFELYVSI